MIFFNLLWLIPILPLLGAVINGVFGKRLPKSAIGGIAAGTVAGSFVLSAGAFLQMLGRAQNDLPIITHYFTWIRSGLISDRAWQPRVSRTSRPIGSDACRSSSRARLRS